MRKIREQSPEYRTGVATWEQRARTLFFKFDQQFVYIRAHGRGWKRMGYEALYVRASGIEAGFEPVATGAKKGARA